MAIKILFGEEDYCVWFKKHKVLDSIENGEFNIAEFSSFDEDLVGYLNTMPMFSTKKAAVLGIKDLKELDTPLFAKYLEEQPDFSELIVIPQKVDKRNKFYKQLDKEGYVEESKKLATNEDLKKMVLHFLKPFGARIKEDACDELIERLNYKEQPNVTLWTVKNAVSNLAQSSLEIDKPLVESMIESNDKENVFLLISYLKKKDLESIRKQEDLIMRSEGSTIGALSALLREFRIGYKHSVLNLSNAQIGVQYVNLTEDEDFLLDGIRTITSIIAQIKKGIIKQDQAISLACEKLLLARAE